MRTFEGIADDNRRWIESGADEKDLKNFNNAKAVPMSFLPAQGIVLYRIPPPSLHIKIGIVNQLYNGLIEVFPAAKAWPEKLTIYQVFIAMM